MLTTIPYLYKSGSSNLRPFHLLGTLSARSAPQKSSRNDLWARKGREEEEVVQGKGQRQGPARRRP